MTRRMLNVKQQQHQIGGESQAETSAPKQRISMIIHGEEVDTWLCQDNLNDRSLVDRELISRLRKGQIRHLR